jgi:hypothetical protein
MSKFSHSKLESLKDKIDKLEVNEHKQIYAIMKKSGSPVTKTQNGVLVSSDVLSDECLLEIEKRVAYYMDFNRKQ